MKEHIATVKRSLNDFYANFVANTDVHLQDLGRITGELDNISSRWLGSWARNYNYYRLSKGNTANQDYEVLNFDDISDEAKENVDTESVWRFTQDALKAARIHRTLALTELSLIKGQPEYSNQIELYEKIEKFEWGVSADRFIKLKRPSQLLADYDVAQQIYEHGLKTPPHIAYGAVVIAKASEIKSIQDYHGLCSRLIREIEIVYSSQTKPTAQSNNSLEIIDNICGRFHLVARQLQSRHSNRSTIRLDDEYDTQDLLHALLRLHFDDVRPEDYSPSYAGRNTRVDFLLKKERIIIEVKKTRDSLGDREIGDELLQDIARYKNHPDCDILYCFVYDPQSIIKNPRGLEQDLNAESNDSFRVVTKIVP